MVVRVAAGMIVVVLEAVSEGGGGDAGKNV